MANKVNPMQAKLAVLKDWQKTLQNEALAFASVVEKNFNFGLNDAFEKRKGANEEAKIEVVMTFIDTLVATTAGICGQYVNKSVEFEERVVQRIRETFADLRKIESDGKDQSCP